VNKIQNNQAGYRQGAVAALVSVIVNILLSAFKLTAGILGHSSAMVADAAHSLSDVAASAAVWVGMKIAVKPADAGHPWGHGKAEPIAAKIVAIILIIVGLDIGVNALINISRADYSTVKPIALIAAIVSIVVKEWNFQYVWRLGKKYDSTSLKADAWHHRSDAISSVAAFIGIAFTIWGGNKWHFMDHLAAAAVAGMIIAVGVKFFRKAAADLMDENLPAERINEIKQALMITEGVKGVEALYARKAGLEILIDAHVEVNPEISVSAGHTIASKARDELKMRFPDIQNVLVHIEPYFPNDH